MLQGVLVYFTANPYTKSIIGGFCTYFLLAEVNQLTGNGLKPHQDLYLDSIL
jgi:hypothetical protein